MSDILLSHSNHVYYDRKQVQKMQPYPPLQTLIAAAVLRQAGFDVAFSDSTLNSPETEFERALDRHSPGLVVVCEDDFNFLTKMCLSRNRELAFWMAAACRSRGVSCAVHGSDSSDHAGEYLDAGFDYVLLGEVETTLVELAGCTPVEQIAGLAYRRRGSNEVRYTALRSVRTRLDDLPMPAWDLIDARLYEDAWRRAHGYFSLNLVTSRGCPYRCNWCAKPIYGNNYHVRSAAVVAAEMRYLKTTFHPDHIWFADDIFALSARWTVEFSRAVEELDAVIPFKMQSRCDLMIRDTVEALRRAGCAEVWMGAESGSQRVLDAMDKSVQVEEIYAARENLARNGIRACFFLQFGYPGETWDDIEATVKMVRELKPDDIGVSVSYPLPRTKFYEKVAGQLGTKANWLDSGDLAMMFRGAYSSEFYRALADALHLEVRGQQGPEAIQNAWRVVGELRGTPAPLAVMPT